MNKSLVTEKELMEWMNYKRSGDLRRLMRDQGIPTLCGIGGSVCTTVVATNQAMGVMTWTRDIAVTPDVIEICQPQ